MVDYVLTDGRGTVVRQSDSLQEGYVDLDMDEVAEVYSSLEDTDRILLQRGATNPRTITVAILRTGLSLDPTDLLNNGYLY